MIAEYTVRTFAFSAEALASSEYPDSERNPTVARIARIVITTMSSTRVNPEKALTDAFRRRKDRYMFQKLKLRYECYGKLERTQECPTVRLRSPVPSVASEVSNQGNRPSPEANTHRRKEEEASYFFFWLPMDPALSPFPAVPTHFVRIPAGRDLTCASVRDSETLRADHVAPAPRFTRAQFERFVDDVFESEKSRASASFVSHFSQAWKIRAKTRFLVGAALAAGSAAALVSGAPAVAGGFLALRAAMGGMGGYFAAESAFDLVAAKIGADPFSRLLRRISQVSSREELDADVREIFDRYEASEIASGIETAKARAERFRGVRRVAAATVGCVFAVIGGSAAAEAATSAVSSVASSVPEIPAVPSLSANSPATEVSEKVASVLADVRHDHPGRPVTLEQAVRRVEGLGRGVPLAQSARLRESVQDASAIVSDPNGKIADAMRRLGYLEPGGSPLRAASRLTEKKISAVLELAYADGADAPSVSDSTVDAPDAPAMAPEDSAATPVPSVRNPSHPEASAMPPSVSPHVHGPAERFADHVPTFSDGARKFLERVGTGAF